MKITIPSRILRSAFSVIDFSDSRKKIVGVRLDTERGEVQATNGHVLYINNETDLSDLDSSITIPPFLISAAGVKKKHIKSASLSFYKGSDEIRVELCSFTGEVLSTQMIMPISAAFGEYPDVSKIIQEGGGSATSSVAFDAEYLAMARNAMGKDLYATFHDSQGVNSSLCQIKSRTDRHSKFVIIGLKAEV